MKASHFRSRFSELKEIATNIDPISFNFEFSHLKEQWEMALYYNRIQNQLIRSGYSNDVVTYIEAKDEETQELKIYEIKALKKWSRKQWFKFLVCKLAYMTIQEIRIEVEKK